MASRVACRQSLSGQEESLATRELTVSERLLTMEAAIHGTLLTDGRSAIGDASVRRLDAATDRFAAHIYNAYCYLTWKFAGDCIVALSSVLKIYAA